ncbi:MAG: hypothetical protein KC442_21665 [Thermomicrobiales bacterium]|nr:hypothetical protein [Thermomicrobiales bacterium]
MDGSTFDKLSQIVSRAGTRRSALSALAAAGIGGAALSSAADAKRKKGKKKKKKCKKTAGKPCTSDKTCCPGKTRNICRVPSNGGNSDTFCCGGTGATCSRNGDGDEVSPVCCTGFPCSAAPGATGTCQPLPPEV